MAEKPIYVLQRINFPGRIVIRPPDLSFTCGRGKDNQAICPSMLVSRRHCIFIVHADGLYVRDLRSSNGVYVNGCRRNRASKINPKDIVGIGIPELKPHAPEHFVYSLLGPCTAEELRELEDDGVVPDLPIKVEKEDKECIPELQNQQMGVAFKRPGELSNNIPSKKIKLEDNQPDSNALDRTIGIDPVPSRNSSASTVPNGSSGANLASSGDLHVDPVPNLNLNTDPVPSTSSAMIPPINVNSIKPDPDNDDIKIIEVRSRVQQNFSEVSSENSTATHCSKINNPEAQPAKLIRKPAEKLANVASKSNESQEGMTEAQKKLTKPCKIIITNIQSIRPNSSLDRSIKENNWIRNHSQNKETETNSDTSSDLKDSGHNPRKEPESNHSDPKLNHLVQKVSQPESKAKNLLENRSGPAIKQSNKENVQYGLLINGHISSSDNVEIKQEAISTDSIKELELSSAKNSQTANGVLESKLNGSVPSIMTNGVSKHCDKPVAKKSSKVRSPKKGKESAETNFASDDELYVVAILNSEGSNFVEHPKTIQEDKKKHTEEGKANYSEFDIVCLSSDDEDEDRFPCSQLFDSVEKESVVKQEPTGEGENVVSESETREDENVILLSDSDDDNESNPWFHRLFNSQVYRPSQDFCVKTEPEEAEQTNEVDQSALDAILGLDEEDPFKKVDDLDTSWKDELPQTEDQDDDVWDENVQSQETAAEEARFFEKRSSSKVVDDTKKLLPKSIFEKSQEPKKLSHSRSERETVKPPKKKIRKMDVVYAEKKEDTFLDDISSEEDFFPRELNATELELQHSFRNFKDSCALPEKQKDSDSLQKSKKHFENRKEHRRDSKDVRYNPRELEDKQIRRSSDDNKESRKSSVIDREKRRSSDENRAIRQLFMEHKERQRSFCNREKRRYSVDNRLGGRYLDETRDTKKDDVSRDRKRVEVNRERKLYDEKSRGRRTDHELSQEGSKENEGKQVRRKQDEENQKIKKLEVNKKRKEHEVDQERRKVYEGDRKKSSEFEEKKISENKASEDNSHKSKIINDDSQRITTEETHKRLFDDGLSKTKNVEVVVQELEKTFGSVTQPKPFKLGKIGEVVSSKRKEHEISVPISNAGPKKTKCFDSDMEDIEAKTLAIKNKIPQRKGVQCVPPHHLQIGRRRGQNLVALKNNDNPEADISKGEDLQNEASRIEPKNIPLSDKIFGKRRSRNHRPQSTSLPREERERKAIERKEKLKQVELDKKSNLEAPAPIFERSRAAATKAKVTMKSRLDLFIEQQTTAPLKPGIAYQRQNNAQPIAHCSKSNPEVEKLLKDSVSSNKIEENYKKKEESPHQVVTERPFIEQEAKEDKENLQDFPSPEFEPLSPEEFMEHSHINNIRNYDDSKVTNTMNKTDGKNNDLSINSINDNQTRVRRSCLAPISINTIKKKNKSVSFNDNLNTIRMYEIETKHSLKRVVGKDAPINRKKSPCQYKLDEYLTRIFDWNPLWLEEQKRFSHEPPVFKGDTLRLMKNRYNSFEEYCNYLRPLLLLEIWNTLSKESESEEKKYKFRSIFCSVARNSIVVDKNSGSELHTTFLMEMLLSADDFKKDLYPGVGHLIIFEYNNVQEEKDDRGQIKRKQTFHRVFAYIKSKSHMPIRHNLHFNKELKRFVPNGEILLTLSVLTKKGVRFPTDQIFRMRGVMYLKASMREIQALQNLPASPVSPLILNPLVDDYQLPEMYQTERNPLATQDDLNKKQIEAVMRISEAALSNKPKISLIHGPPGTGKSKVIVNIVAQILLRGPDTKILVCAPSNAAIDEIVIRLLGIRLKLNLKNLKMVRVGRPETMNPKVKNVSLAELGRKQVEKDHKVPEEDERIKIEAHITKLEVYLNLIDKKMENLKRNGESIGHLVKQRQQIHSDYKMLKFRKNPVDLKELSFAEVNRRHRETEELVLSKATVIACTLSSCYSGMMEKLFGEKGHQKIQICIVDEATQSCETESLIPLMLGVEKMILVGDTNQLPATILSKTAKEMGLDQSLFSRLEKTFADQTENPIIMLDTQYRMDYPISSWPNSYFYKGKLKDKAVIKYVPFSSYRVLNLNSIQDEGKFSNTNEAEFVSKIVYVMVTSADLNSLKDPLQIGVITPYQSQRNVIYSRIERRLDSVSSEKKNKVAIEVNTVDSFQGQERDVIIMSCVRTSGIGFMSDKQRLCVALTRAKSSLILCGNFKTFERDEMWNELLTDARQRDIYVDVEANASLEEIKCHVLR